MSQFTYKTSEENIFLESYINFQNIDFSLKMIPKNSGELSVLCILAKEEKPLMSGEIAQMLNLPTSRTAALLNALEKKGQIKRIHSKEDKRITYVSLTEKGEQICEDMKQSIFRKVKKAYEVLGKEEMEHFMNTVQKLCEISKEDSSC